MRLGVFSNQNLRPWVNWTTLGPPLLHPLAAHDGAQLIAPPSTTLTSRSAREWWETLEKVWSSDTLFWMQGVTRPELSIHIPALLRGPVRRSAFVVDVRSHVVAKVGALAVLQQLNPCFVAFREGCDELKRHFPRGHFEWMPFGVDTDVFDSVPGERPIFAYWMGRRYEALHQAMIAYCEKRGLEYRYTRKAGEFTDPVQLGRLVGSTQYFLVSPPDLADPDRTGGFSPFVMRYLEGLAAGARLLGVLPEAASTNGSCRSMRSWWWLLTGAIWPPSWMQTAKIRRQRRRWSAHGYSSGNSIPGRGEHNRSLIGFNWRRRPGSRMDELALVIMSPDRVPWRGVGARLGRQQRLDDRPLELAQPVAA